MTINPDQTVKFPPMHRLQWEEAQQKDVILYPEGMVEPWATPFYPPLLSAKIELGGQLSSAHRFYRQMVGKR